MMNIQKFLLNNSLASLKEEHKVNFRIHDHKFSLNYNMLEADDTDVVACECRGLVLHHEHPVDSFDENVVVGNTTVMSRTMNRFFNHGQGAAADIDFNNPSELRFYEKLDGTMTSLYWDFVKSEWHVGTRSVPEADLKIDGFEDAHTFRSLFEKAVEETANISFADWLDSAGLHKGMTYIFELCTPENQVVVKHDDYRVFLIACRNNVTGAESLVSDVHLKGIPVCKTYSLSSFEDMIKFVSERDPKKHEGIVVADYHFNRVKVKNAEYLALSKLSDSVSSSPRAVVELFLKGCLDDVLPLLPAHMVGRVEKMQEGLRKALGRFNAVYDECFSEALVVSSDNGWDMRKSLAVHTKSKHPEYLGYVMTRYSSNGKINSLEDYLKTQIDPLTGGYKRGFLDFLVNQINV